MPLRGLQLLCCAAVAAVGLHISFGLGQRTDPARVAISAFETARQGESPVDTALQAARAGLSEIKVVVKRNDTLDQIFRRLEFSLSDLANIRALDAARHALDRLRPGDLLTFFIRGEQLVALVRPVSLSQTLRVERNDTDQFVASVEEVPLQKNVVTASGTIESSFYAASAEAGLRVATIMALEEQVFQWDINFFSLPAGDSFTVIYEHLERDGVVVADGDVLAADFVNDGKLVRAVRYVNAEGKAGFYTPEGISVRKAFLKAPLLFSRISSGFNPNRRHPVLNTIRAHRGVDYAAPSGTEVRAVSAGRVQFRGVKGGFGNVVEIAHSKKILTRYGHLSRFAKNAAAGSKVEQGEIIGYVGSTGLATGPHLHFEFMKGGVYVDPQEAIRSGEAGPQVPASERDEFALQTAPLLAQLDARRAATGAALVAR
ncbi:MAG: peptidoglycan DD-metalloendopeptidase family protein [Steroidobacteraceae bacterium]